MRLYLIRHGITEGNKNKAYIGAGTDEPLCEEGMTQLLAKSYPEADLIFVSPMRRCIMTAERIYPNREIILCEGLKEMDFGDFEGNTYEELKDNPIYVNWLESGGETSFPSGETKQAFVRRVQDAFYTCMRRVCQCGKDVETVAFVVHGGTIMAIMQKYAEPKGKYYEWQIANGEFIELNIKLQKFK